MIKTIQKQKAVVGLDVVETVIFSLLIIGVISIASLLALYSLLPSVDMMSTSSNTITNETGAWINSTGYSVAHSTDYNFGSPVITAIYKVQNGVYNVTVPTANATISAAGVITPATATTYANVSISYSYSKSNNNAAEVIYNITEANTSFFGNSSTFFSILSIIVIIALIALIILYIKQFRGNTETV